MSEGKIPPEERSAVEKRYNAIMLEVAQQLSTAKILTENEPIGDLVVLSLLDDTLPKNELGGDLALIAAWLGETEKRYRAQFPDHPPARKNGRLDLSKKPDGFKSRLQVFTELVQEAESGDHWSAKLIFNDPVVLSLKMKKG